MIGSNVGTWMHRIAQMWLALEITGDPAILGVVTALQFAPILFIGPWAGALAERSDRRKLLIWMQVALALQAALLGVVVLSGSMTTTLLFIFSALLGVATAIDGPARQSFVSDLVDRAELPNAVALNSTSFNTARLIGPAAAGFIIAAWGTGWVFLLNAATFGLMIVALLRIHTRVTRVEKEQARVSDGVKFVLGHSDLLFVILLAGLVSMFVLNFQMTIAVMATEQFAVGAQTYGILASVMAIGSLAGALLAARRGRTSLRIVTFSALGLAGGSVIAGLSPNAWWFGASLVVCGIAALSMMTGANAYLQTHSGSKHRSRVMALYLAIFFGTTPIGAPLAGWLADFAGPRASLVVPGILAAIATGALVIWFRHRSRTEAHSPDTTPAEA